MNVTLQGLATALAPYELPQDLVQERAKTVLGPKYPQFERLLSTFVQSGIERRRSVAPLEWFDDGAHGWAERNRIWHDGCAAMWREAAEGALSDAGWRGDEVDVVITVSTSGLATPTLEAVCHEALGFRPDVMRVPVFGLGCAGGASGLSIAAQLAQGRPGSKVLLVVVEACTPSFRTDRLQKSDIIATVLFGDGAAAACLSTDGDGAVTLSPGVQHMWPDTLGIMGWDVDDEGLGVVFDRAIPAFVTAHMPEAVDAALTAMRRERDDFDRLLCHPGGAKVLTALEASLELGQGALDLERDVLREHGNMSAPTVLFVLDAARRGGHTGRFLLSALGPGFTASFVPLEIAA
ncbi:Alpha-pyrone synthesis polyketide synthase-like Pks11 [Jannaschia seosinensis]|uniref:Alpha-pyrone synthesis polyketide synthase-like Pks11 n=1 Tax=Jannaschia seosinensis TaxID=313367 RepID=A0A0M7B5B6_9RHOB|nr:chalcone synthase [Jannaschia seosinensis]CUH26053.1 Alpha-pyrone synthesis polyketide synthase-like Pks11 [Jannaschia seosinensis]